MATPPAAGPKGSMGRFTVAILRRILDDGVLKQSQTKPGQVDLELLANSLNQIRDRQADRKRKQAGG
jgi:hypothetical protein